MASSPQPAVLEHFKDSCGYSVETAKQFLTFAAGGLAFITGLSLSPGATVSPVYFWAFGLFIGGIIFGLIYIMAVVGHINRSKNYDVYTPGLRICSVLQIVSVLTGAILLGCILFLVVRVRPNSAPSGTSFELNTGNRVVRYVVPPGSPITVRVSANGEVDLRIDAQQKVGP